MATQFVVETGAGLTNSNSFASVAAADQYVENYTADVAWIGAPSSLKEKHLRLATQYISANWVNSWKGVKASGLQALMWPRYGVCVDGYELGTSPLPQALIEATCEAALRSINGDILIPDYAAGASGVIRSDVTIGPLEFEYEYGSASSPTKVFNIINTLLRPLIVAGGVLLRG